MSFKARILAIERRAPRRVENPYIYATDHQLVEMLGFDLDELRQTGESIMGMMFKAAGVTAVDNLVATRT